MTKQKRVSRNLVGINFRHPNVMPNFAVWETITYRHWHKWCCILDCFSITGIAQTATEIHISLDERMNKALSNDAQFESKGFMAAVNVTDFPIRDHKVVLRIRHRR